VQYRKNCYGTHSAAGSRFVERILTAVTTLGQQGRNVLEYLTAACAAAQTGRRAPSLLPSRALLRAAA
jgi:transposase